MAKLCPQCGNRQNVVGHITVDGLPPKSADDVIAERLACGHVVGGEGYDELVAEVRRIDVEAVKDIEEIKLYARNAKTAAYKAHVEGVNEVDAE